MSRPSGSGPQYELVLAAKSIPLHALLKFARAVGIQVAQNLKAQGTVSATLRFTGQVWPYQSPRLSGQAELRMARLLVPGLTEPLNLPKAHLEFSERGVVADPLVVVIGTGVFFGHVEHRGGRKEPWEFDLRTKALSLEQGAQWFDALGRRKPLQLLEHLPGLGSFAARRTAASSILGALNARGWFSTPKLTYRALALRDFQASVEVSGRLIRIRRARFLAGGGQGEGNAIVDLAAAPAATQIDFQLTHAALPALAPHLPPALRQLRGTLLATGHFETRGLTHDEMTANLRGRATLHLGRVSLLGFDPVDALLRAAGLGTLEPARGPTSIHVAPASFSVANRHVLLEDASLELEGVKLKLGGSYRFDGLTDLNLRADLSGLRRRWLEIREEGALSRFDFAHRPSFDFRPGMASVQSSRELAEGHRELGLHLAGSVHQLAVTHDVELSHRLP